MMGFIVILAKFLLMGKKVKILQKIGLFISLLAIIIGVMALTKDNKDSDDFISQYNFNSYKLIAMSKLFPNNH